MRMKPTRFDYKEILFSDSSDYEDDQTSFTFDYESFKPFNIDEEMNKAYKRNESRINREIGGPFGQAIKINPIEPGFNDTKPQPQSLKIRLNFKNNTQK